MHFRKMNHAHILTFSEWFYIITAVLKSK